MCKACRHRSPRHSPCAPPSLGLHHDGRETAQEPELDLGAAIGAAHVSDVAVDEVAEPACRAGAAVKAGQKILCDWLRAPEAPAHERRPRGNRGANLCPCQLIMLITSISHADGSIVSAKIARSSSLSRPSANAAFNTNRQLPRGQVPRAAPSRFVSTSARSMSMHRLIPQRPDIRAGRA